MNWIITVSSRGPRVYSFFGQHQSILVSHSPPGAISPYGPWWGQKYYFLLILLWIILYTPSGDRKTLHQDLKGQFEKPYFWPELLPITWTMAYTVLTILRTCMSQNLWKGLRWSALKGEGHHLRTFHKFCDILNLGRFHHRSKFRAHPIRHMFRFGKVGFLAISGYFEELFIAKPNQPSLT